MRRKRWLTVAMIVTAAVAVMMAATSYKEIGKKLEMQGEDQQTMLVAGYELQTETEASTAKTETSDTEMASETEKETETKEKETRTYRSVKAGPEIKAEKDRDQGRRCV